MATLDTGWLLFRLKRALRTEFPDESLKGTTFYTSCDAAAALAADAHAPGQDRRRPETLTWPTEAVPAVGTERVEFAHGFLHSGPGPSGRGFRVIASIPSASSMSPA